MDKKDKAIADLEDSLKWLEDKLEQIESEPSLGKYCQEHQYLEERIEIYKRKLEASKLLLVDNDVEEDLKDIKVSKYFLISLSSAALDSAHIKFVVTLDPSIQSYIYESAISSYSGSSEWAEEHLDNVYSFLTGNSKYNYALGTNSLRDVLDNDVKKFNEFPCQDEYEKVVEKFNFYRDYFEGTYGKMIGEQADSIIDKLKELDNDQ